MYVHTITIRFKLKIDVDCFEIFVVHDLAVVVVVVVVFIVFFYLFLANACMCAMNNEDELYSKVWPTQTSVQIQKNKIINNV